MGKNIKDMLLNIGSESGASAIPASGAATGRAATEAPTEEEKERSDLERGYRRVYGGLG